MGLNNKKKMVLEYQSSSDINYRVFLKENNFFNEEYLEMNKTYIASLIDYLDVVFNYNLKYSEIVSGEYKYYIKATIYADKDATSKVNYWSKSYNLTEPETIKFEDAKDFIVTSRDGFDFGSIHLKGIGEFENNTYRIDFQNENIASYYNEKPDVTVPDLICMIAGDGEPVTTPDFAVGDEMLILALPAPEPWTTPEGLKIFGPQHFGLETEYVPFSRRKRG